MARPVNADAEQTRARILGAATRRFAAEGTSASMRTVARAAGVSLATVHHYFGTKEGLYAACVQAMDAEFGGLRDELARIVGEGHGTLDELLDAVVRRAYGFAREHLLAVRLTTRDAIERGEIDPGRQQGMLLTGLEAGAPLVERLTGCTPEAARLTLRSLAYLLVRYALTDTRELALVLGLDPEDHDAAACQQAVEDHLVFTARALLAALSGGTS